MSFTQLNNAYKGTYADPKPPLQNIYIVPQDKSFGINSLTHEVPYNSTVYFNIDGAYPQKCTRFGYRRCGDSQITKTINTDSILRYTTPSIPYPSSHITAPTGHMVPTGHAVQTIPNFSLF